MRIFIVALVLFSATWLGVSAQQNHSLVWIKVLDESSDLITLDGDPRVAVNLARATEIKQNEAKLHELQIENAKLSDQVVQLQANVQDGRLALGIVKQSLAENQENVKTCFALLKKGGGRVGKFLDNPFVRLGEDIAKTAIQIQRCN